MADKNKDKLNILWLSDIHYEINENNNSVKELSEKFLDIIREADYSSDIRYILLTGDIANSGKKEEYELFEKKILAPLKEICPNAVCLQIPGNHDLNRDNKETFDKYIKACSEAVDKSATPLFRENHVAAELNSMQNFFSDYTTFHKNHFVLEENEEFSFFLNYKEEGLYGYFIDNKHKILFILLNTAWFDAGTEFYKKLAEFKNLQYPDKTAITKDIIDDILNHSKYAYTKGNLTPAINLFEKAACKLEEIINNNDDKFIITCMHHPVDYLTNADRYPPGNGDSEEPTPPLLLRVLQKSDCVLTGHIHSPKYEKPEKKGNTVYFKGGVFNDNETKVLDSRFSIFEIDTSKQHFEYNELRFERKNTNNAKSEADKESAVWKQIPKEGPFKTENKTLFFSPERKTQLTELIKNKFNYLDFFIYYYDNSLKKEDLSELNNDNAFVKIYSNIDVNNLQKNNRVIILICNPNFLNQAVDCLKLEAFNQFVQNFLLENKDVLNKTTVTFLLPDFFMESLNKDLAYTAKKQENQGNFQGNRNAIFNNISRYNDILFDNFRHWFFENMNKNYAETIDFKLVKNISLTSHVIPYWKIEKYLRE